MMAVAGDLWSPLRRQLRATQSQNSRLACPFQQSAIQPSTLIRLETMVLLVALHAFGGGGTLFREGCENGPVRPHRQEGTSRLLLRDWLQMCHLHHANIALAR